MQQGLIELGAQGQAFLYALGGLYELIQGDVRCGARHIFNSRTLKVQGPNLVRSGFQQIGQLIKLVAVGLCTCADELPVDGDPPPKASGDPSRMQPGMLKPGNSGNKPACKGSSGSYSAMALSRAR